MMSGALPIGAQPEITRTVDPEDDDEQIVTSRPQQTSRHTMVEQSVISQAENVKVAEPSHKITFKDSLSSLPSCIKLF
jgi:hypothetical protein